MIWESDGTVNNQEEEDDGMNEWDADEVEAKIKGEFIRENRV